MDTDKRQVGLRLDRVLWQKFKVQATIEDRPAREIIEQLVAEYLERIKSPGVK